MLQNLTIKKFNEGLMKKEFSVFEITKAFFDLIKKEDKKIGAYLRLSEESALTRANIIDAELNNGSKLNILAGTPLAIKDNILINGTITTAASKILENYTASYDATVIKKLKKAGAIFLGKTNMDEFAMGSSTENSAFQKTKNPRDLERVPGGSSGGSAAAVAADMAVAALGSDTGGSIRQPANFCGVVGLKPTYGAVSRFGLIAMASSLDQIGPIAKTVEDAAILFKEIFGRDELDLTSVDFNPPAGGRDEFVNPDFNKIKKLKIGLPKEYFTVPDFASDEVDGGRVEGLDKKTQKAVQKTIETLKKIGFEFKEISLPHTKYALSCYYIIMPAEVSANLARFDGLRYAKNEKLEAKNLKEIYLKNRGEGFGEEVKRRIILGTFVLSSGYYDAYYSKAQKVRRLIKEDFDKAFGDVDVILTPVSPTPAFKIGEKTDDPLKMYLEDIFTIPVNLAGLPAISIPVNLKPKTQNLKSNLPIGFQLIGKHFREADILGIGRLYENGIYR
ncbi:Asp-tRNA(Asn)/Glu-tRNA(Gln) amidotransferase subunit GatA [Candidatus Wolfebacteria bacterium]|nr:Asp-tRNA(Asn)/Glu-tRNA(Gln) amidotransferase subunit GatA [Candidatus Wolfebacteria bacterium]